MQTHKLAVAIACSLATSITAAETQKNESTSEEALERIVVVSNRVETPLKQVTTSVSVVSEEEIINRGYANLAEVLRVQPSIHVDNSGGIGSPTSLRIRGEEGFRTLVRIDGIEISDPSGPQVLPQLGQLQSANIQQVEILRGPQGLAYGADAGGVINIISGSGGEELSGGVSAQGGRYGTHALDADIGGQSGAFDYYFAASDYGTDGFNSRVDDASGDEDGYDNTTVHTRLGYQINDQFKVGLVARNTDGEGEYDNCFLPDFSSTNDCSTDFEQTNTRLSLDYDGDWGAHQLAYTTSDIEREFFSAGQSSFYTEGELERIEYLGQSQLNDAHQLVYGFDWEREEIPTNQLSRVQRGYYLEYQGELSEQLLVTAGARHDDNSEFGEHTSYRLTAAYFVPVEYGEYKLRAAYGTGFRAPSLSEIDYNAGPFAFGAAAETQLKEEKTEGYEMAIEFTANNGSQYQIVYFDQKVEDAILFDLVGFSGYLQEEGEADSDGVELIADIKLSDEFGFSANYTYNDTSDTSGQQRLRRPEHLANVGLFYQGDVWKLNVNLRMVDGLQDIGGELDGYEVTDISARYAINQQLEVFARIENLFDREYQDIAAFNTLRRAAHAGVRYQF